MTTTDRRQFVRTCDCGCGQPTAITRHTNRKNGQIKGQPNRFMAGHGTRRPAPDRFWEKVNADGVCWEWDGARKSHGYGNFAPVRTKTVLAHRWAWEYLVGPIPPGMELDHRCQNTRCVCPDHLEVVSPQINSRRSQSQSALNARKTHCKYDHKFTPENIRINKKGDRVCRECEAYRTALRRRAERAERAERAGPTTCVS